MPARRHALAEYHRAQIGAALVYTHDFIPDFHQHVTRRRPLDDAGDVDQKLDRFDLNVDRFAQWSSVAAHIGDESTAVDILCHIIHAFVAIGDSLRTAIRQLTAAGEPKWLAPLRTVAIEAAKAVPGVYCCTGVGQILFRQPCFVHSEREVTALHFVIHPQRLDGVAIDDLTFVDDGSVARDAEAEMHILLSQQYCYAHVAKLSQQFTDPIHDHWRQSLARFVK